MSFFKMKEKSSWKIVYLIIFLFLVLAWFFCFFYRNEILWFLNKTVVSKDSWDKILSSSWWVEEIGSGNEKIIANDISKEDVKEKIDILRKRYSLKWIIVEWDLYSNSSQYTMALIKYNLALKENPDDVQIASKIADVYFNMKKFDRAYEFYKKLINTNYFDQEKTLLSLFYSKELLSENIDYFKKEILELWLSEEDIFFFNTLFSCPKDFHLCKKDFWEYFSNRENISSTYLLSIKEAIDNYESFQVDEVYYKNTLIIGSLFENKLYDFVIVLWKEVLLEKPNYNPVLLMIAKSYYELWDYKNSKTFLMQYYEENQWDLDAIYLLWVLNLELKEYLLSNIFFNKALDKWYSPSINIKRRIIFNYHEIWDMKRMLSAFKDLVTTELNLDREDVNLAVYYHIINSEIAFAKSLSLNWIEKHPEDDLFYSYVWWVEKEMWNIDEAIKYLDKWYEINSQSPMTNYLKWQIEFIRGDYKKAFVYFKKTVWLDPNGEYWKLAKDELEKLQVN